MGNKPTKSKDNPIEILDYSMVKIPTNYKLIKLASYDINLKNTINLDLKIKEIINYTISKNKNLEIDILCIQGIHDNNSVFEIIREIKKYLSENKIHRYISPPTEDNPNSFSTKKIFDITYSGTDYGNKKKIFHNIIISRYPIINHIIDSLNNLENLDSDNIICANINIFNNIISVYNINLSGDIKHANIKNSATRDLELNKIFNIIEKNKNKLELQIQYQTNNKLNIKKYNKSDINFLVGSLNISEVNQTDPNPEFINLIQTRHAVDIYRYLPANNTNPGYTTAYKERLNYILLLFTEDLFQEASPFYKKIKNIKNPKELFKIIFNRYSIYFFDSTVYNNIYNITNNYSVETIFMVQKSQ